MMLFSRRNKDGLGAANEALHEARHNLAEAKKRDPEVQQLTTALRVLRERNHFIEKLGVIMEGGK